MNNAQSKVSVAISAKLDAEYNSALKQADEAIKKVDESTKKLSKQVADIGSFRKQENVIKDVAKQFNDARKTANQLREEYEKLDKPTRQQTNALRSAERAVKSTQDAYTRARQKLNEMSAELKNAGINTSRLSDEYKRLKREVQAANEAKNKQLAAQKQAELDAIKRLQDKEAHEKKLAELSRQAERESTARMHRLADVQRRMEQEERQRQIGLNIVRRDAELESIGRQRRLEQVLSRNTQRVREQEQAARRLERAYRTVGSAAAGIGAGGYAVRQAGGIVANEAKSMAAETAKIEALGLGSGTTNQAVSYARSQPSYGISEIDRVSLIKDALSVFADLHHAEMAYPTLAKMKFGNEAVFGLNKGADNERIFMDMLKVIELRGGVKSQEAFARQADLIQKVIAATGGRVGPEEWRHLIATGKLAAKSMADENFYFQLEPLVQEQGGDRVGTGLMSGYSNLYQGKTTKRAVNNLEKLGLIGDMSKVKHDKAGQLSYLNPGALKGADIFLRSQYDWMKLVLLPTLAQKGITNQQDILDTIGSIYSNRNGADLMASMVMQQMQIDKNVKLNKGAYDVNQLYNLGLGMTSGKELEAKAQKENIEVKLGESILPTYTQAVEKATEALKSFSSFLTEHPTGSKVAAFGGLGLLAGFVGLKAAAGYSFLSRLISGGGAAAAATSSAAPAALGSSIPRFTAMGLLGRNAGRLGTLGLLGMGAYNIYGDATNQSLNTGQKAAAITGEVGGMGGAWAGAQAGAAAGALAGGWGAIPGALIGGYLGYKGGSALGSWAGDKIFNSSSSSDVVEAAKTAAEAAKTSANRPNVTIHNSYDVKIDTTQPGALELQTQMEKFIKDAQRKADADLRSQYYSLPGH